MNFSTQDMNKQNSLIQQLVLKHKKSLSPTGVAQQHGFAEKISLLSDTIVKNCKPCEETDLHMKMLQELASDLPKLDHVSKPVMRSVEKRFAHIVKHLQKAHNFSIKHQHRDAWMILLISLLGIVGVILSALTSFLFYPLIGIAIGAIIGYLIGSNIDQKMEKENKLLKN